MNSRRRRKKSKKILLLSVGTHVFKLNKTKPPRGASVFVTKNPALITILVPI